MAIDKKKKTINRMYMVYTLKLLGTRTISYKIAISNILKNEKVKSKYKFPLKENPIKKKKMLILKYLQCCLTLLDTVGYKYKTRLIYVFVWRIRFFFLQRTL